VSRRGTAVGGRPGHDRPAATAAPSDAGARPGGDPHRVDHGTAGRRDAARPVDQTPVRRSAPVAGRSSVRRVPGPHPATTADPAKRPRRRGHRARLAPRRPTGGSRNRVGDPCRGRRRDRSG
jgi:hypothetical protein